MRRHEIGVPAIRPARPPEDIPGTEKEMPLAAFSPDGRRSALAFPSGRVLDDGEEHAVDGPRQLAWSPDGRTLAVGGSDGRVALLPVGRWAAHAGPVSALAWTPDGRGLLSGGSDGRVSFFDAGAGRLSDAPLVLGEPVTALAAGRDRLAAGTLSGAVRSWPLEARAEGTPAEVRARLEALTGVRLGEDGEAIVRQE
ncbi:MAG: hypothetical protein K2W96_18600 [Gemmataceae bacterium]|nr:hypothetical protein [Gemmataceae bacterium]